MSHTAVRVTYAGNVGTAFVPDDAKPSKGVSFMHDVDHPGVSNAFLSNIEDALALRYNDVSVLENHHAALTCELLRDSAGGLDVLADFPLPERRRMRAVVIAAILSTDMTKHFGDVVPAAKALTLPLCRPTDAEGQPRRAEAVALERTRLGEVLLHAADLSGQVLPWPLAEQWSDRVVVEFRVQVRGLRGGRVRAVGCFNPLAAAPPPLPRPRSRRLPGCRSRRTCTAWRRCQRSRRCRCVPLKSGASEGGNAVL